MLHWMVWPVITVHWNRAMHLNKISGQSVSVTTIPFCTEQKQNKTNFSSWRCHKVQTCRSNFKLLPMITLKSAMLHEVNYKCSKANEQKRKLEKWIKKWLTDFGCYWKKASVNYVEIEGKIPFIFPVVNWKSNEKQRSFRYCLR